MKHLKTFFELFESISFDTSTTGRDDWDDTLKKQPNNFTQIVAELSPEEYLKRVMFHRYTVDKDKVAKYVKQFKNAKDIPAPTMWFADEHQYKIGLAPTWHDGSHRMLALKELGIRKVPVKIIY